MSNSSGKILVTGSAGFIGFHVCKKLLEDGHCIVGFDSLNNYYDPKLKEARLDILQNFNNFTFIKGLLEDRSILTQVFDYHQPSYVINLAAQAGVRYSLENPKAYIDSNIVGFLNILECCRHSRVEHLVYASTSSVYGANKKLPFSTRDPVDHPISLYAATKKSNELFAHSYSHLFKIPTTGLRFFTVYGPWGRPDMALFLFTKAILDKRPIDIFNYGNMKRDFTYIDDIVQGITKVLFKIPAHNTSHPTDGDSDPADTEAPYKVFNIGNNSSVNLMYAIELIEKELGIKAKKNLMPMQPGDVEATYAEIDAIKDWVGFQPRIPLNEGIKFFIDWYRSYY